MIPSAPASNFVGAKKCSWYRRHRSANSAKAGGTHISRGIINFTQDFVSGEQIFRGSKYHVTGLYRGVPVAPVVVWCLRVGSKACQVV